MLRDQGYLIVQENKKEGGLREREREKRRKSERKVLLGRGGKDRFSEW